MSKDSDEDLMRQVRDGNRDCAGTLVRRYASALLTYVVRMIGDRHKAEELVQEVFLAVWAKRLQYQHPRPFRPWLYAIATNQCRVHFRRARPKPVMMDESQIVEESADPAEAYDMQETASLVTAAITELPQQQRSVVALRIWNGLSYAEIAKATRCSEATARSHMHHGLARLRSSLEPRLGDLKAEIRTSQRRTS